MASYKYSHEYEAFIKQCSHCKETTIGTKDVNESIAIFGKVFSCSGPSSGAADGMQSRCWACNSSKRRALGVTRVTLQQMWEAQNKQCAICSNEISIVRNAEPAVHAHVDHCENTGKVRGLLCRFCNQGIGMLFHKAENLRRAIEYIEKNLPKEVVTPFPRRV